MTVKEMIVELSKYPEDMVVLSEYDSSFLQIIITEHSLWMQSSEYREDEYSTRHYNNSKSATVLIIHSGNYLVLRDDPNELKSTTIHKSTEIEILELEYTLPKIKKFFEQDNLFYKKLR